MESGFNDCKIVRSCCYINYFPGFGYLDLIDLFLMVICSFIIFMHFPLFFHFKRVIVYIQPY